MPGEGPFLWLVPDGPDAGFRALPPGGMCVSVFLLVRRAGADPGSPGSRDLLLGRYADDPRWEALTGLDAARRRQHGRGWTLPATHLKFGEDPRAAARRVAEEVLQLRGVGRGEPRVQTDLYERPGRGGAHFDLWFLVDAEAPGHLAPKAPPWYAALEWRDPAALAPAGWARGHEDVYARWDAMR